MPGVKAAWAFFVLLTPLVALAQFERGEPLPRKGALGAQLAPLTADEAKAAGTDQGLRIVAVVPGLTAAALGLAPNDALLSLNGTALAGPGSVQGLVRTLKSGSTVTAEVVRNGQRITLTAPLAERPRQKGDGTFEVVYDQVVSKGKRIRVIATHPKGAGPFPTVFVIGGIGAYSTDAEFEAIPYGTILGPLSRAGYAIVRVDKPGQGDSEGPAYTDLLFDDELDAYLQAVRLTKSFPFVDRERIAIFGHSMGGTFGPLVAAEEPVAAVIASATLSKTWIEYVLENTRRQSELGGADAATVDAEMRQVAAIAHYLYYEGLSPREVAEKRPELAAAVTAMIPDGKTYSGVGIQFFQQLAKKDLGATWARVNAKVLALWGENDFVSGWECHEHIATVVNGLRPRTATAERLPQSDHGFFKTESFKDSLAKWGRPGNTFNPNVVDTLQAWLTTALGKG